MAEGVGVCPVCGASRAYLKSEQRWACPNEPHEPNEAPDDPGPDNEEGN